MAEVSIVIPAYNTGAYLGECLASIANQTFGNFEVFVIDDGSKDNCLAIAQDFASKDSRFKVIHQQNSGMASARNVGIKMTPHETTWITFIDSDDILSPDYLDHLIKTALENGADICCCDKEAFKDSSSLDLGSHPLTKNTLNLTNLEATRNSLYQNEYPDYSVWNKIYKFKLWEGRYFPEGKFFEDLAVVPVVLSESNKVVFLKEPLYKYRKHGTSFLATSFVFEKTVILDVAEKIYEKYKNDKFMQGAATSTLASSCFSIILRTKDEEPFKEFRRRSWEWIRALRWKTIWDPKTRMRNKIAAIASYGGEKFLGTLFRRFG